MSEIVFGGSFGDSPGAIAIRLESPLEASSVPGTLALRQGTDELVRIPIRLLGYDLKALIHLLESLSQTLSGSGEWVTLSEETTIRITAVSNRRGYFKMSGETSGLLSSDIGVANGGQGAIEPAVAVTFNGLYIDQSVLWSAVAAIRQFLSESDITTDDPWGR